MTEPQSYGVLRFRCRPLRFGDQLASALCSRPWMKPCPATRADADAEDAEDALLRSNKFNVCISDSLFFESGRGLESVFLCLSNMPAPSEATGQPRTVSQFQIVNHLPCAVSLTCKAALVRSLNRQLQGSPTHPFDIMPTTYFIPASSPPSLDSPTLSAFYKRFAAVASGNVEGLRLPAKQCACNLWILKPTLCGGAEEAVVISSPSEVSAYMRASKGDFVIQKYSECWT
jgi:hypothetical protein